MSVLYGIHTDFNDLLTNSHTLGSTTTWASLELLLSGRIQEIAYWSFKILFWQ
jgi:hypothetical protein